MLINEDYLYDNKLLDWVKYMREHTEEFPVYLSWVHGITHWEHVEAFGLMMAEEVPETDKEVIQWFAYLHDCRRGSDGCCEEHGQAAAKFIKKIRKTFLSELSDEQVKILILACKSHTLKHRTGNITADICLDADRLDLPRVGIIPEPKKMASAIGAMYAKMPYEEVMKKAGL